MEVNHKFQAYTLMLYKETASLYISDYNIDSDTCEIDAWIGRVVLLKINDIK